MIIKNLDVITFPQNHVFLSVAIIKFPKPSSFPHNLVHLPAAIIGLLKPSSFLHFLVFLPVSIFKLPKPSSFPNNHTYLIGERNRRFTKGRFGPKNQFSTIKSGVNFWGVPLYSGGGRLISSLCWIWSPTMTLTFLGTPEQGLQGEEVMDSQLYGE